MANYLIGDERIDLQYEHWCYQYAQAHTPEGDWKTTRQLSYGLRLVGKRMLRSIRSGQDPKMNVTASAQAQGICAHHPALVFEALADILAKHRARVLADASGMLDALPGSVALAVESATEQLTSQPV